MGHVRHPLGTLVVSAALAGTAAPVMAQLVKPFSVDRDYISVVRPTDVTEHFSLDVITSAPAQVTGLVTVGSRTRRNSDKGLHIVTWSNQNTIVMERLFSLTSGGELVGYGVDVATNKDFLVAGEFIDGLAAGTFACRITPAGVLRWQIGLRGQYTTPVPPWSWATPTVAIKELANGNVAVARTLYLGGGLPSWGLLSCLDPLTGALVWSMMYQDPLRSIEFLDFAVAPPGGPVPAGTICVVGSLDGRALVMYVNPANGSMALASNMYNHVQQWRGIDFHPATGDMFLAGVRFDQIFACTGHQVVVARITPNTCNNPAQGNWMMTDPGNFVPAPSAIGFRTTPTGSPERVLVAGATTCYDRSLGLILDAATGIPTKIWSDVGGSGSYARTRDLAGTMFNFTAHTIGTRGAIGTQPFGAYVSAASCVQDLQMIPESLPIECDYDDTVLVVIDQQVYPRACEEEATASIEVYNCRRPLVVNGPVNKDAFEATRWP